MNTGCLLDQQFKFPDYSLTLSEFSLTSQEQIPPYILMCPQYSNVRPMT